MMIPDLTPRFMQVSPQRAHKIRSTCAWLGYPALLACLGDGVLLVYFTSRPEGSIGTGVLGGLSVFFCFLAAFTMASCRYSVPNGYLNLTDARFARRMPWVAWAFSVPTTGMSLLVLLYNLGGRFAMGWGFWVYGFALALPFLLTTVIGVRTATLFQAPFYHGPVPPHYGPVPPQYWPPRA
jgi:hypothetical protein